MSVSVEQMADEIAKMLTEYETAIVKNVDASGKAVADKGAKQLRQTSPKKNRRIRKKLGRDKRSGRIRRKREVYRSQQKAVSADTPSGAWSCDGKRQTDKSNPAH